VTLEDRIEQAFGYRGYVTVSRRDGSKLVGFVYDRGPAHIEMFDESATARIRVPVAEVADIELTGDDTAARAHRMWERRKGALEPKESSVWGGWEEERPILVVVALPLELRSVAAAMGAKARDAAVRGGRLGDSRAVAVAVGMGGGSAHVIAREKPRLVLACGFSGALDPTLAPGDLVLATSVADELGESFPASERLLAAARRALAGQRVAEGEILCATDVAATAGEKRALAAPGRLAVDLESGPAARAAAAAGIPWLALRVVLDPVGEELPAFTREPRDSYIAPALRHALGGVGPAVQLARLGWAARAATRSLERAIRVLAPALAEEERGR
jgi:adenosylhomocysteine nucleosidase